MTAENVRVMVAEDESLVGDVIQNHLERSGHRVVARAADGRQAVELAQAMKPDVVFMDIEMPEMNGLDATRMIIERAPTPVILLTAHDNPRYIVEASVIGAVGYIAKPSSAREMDTAITIGIARFNDIMELRRLNAELRDAMRSIKMLSGLLPICGNCKKIRADDGIWHTLEGYIMQHSDATFTHGICPECLGRLFPENGSRQSLF
ncbi:MAG: ANTAR domain-containing response regulator [Acidobacteriota bacterium]